MWVGAALLFVATSVTEQVQPSFSGDIKDTLALIRFPWFYGFGALLLALAAASSFLASALGCRGLSAAVLLACALCIMGADYALVYRPMRALLVPVASGRGAEFERLHALSEWANGIGLVAATAAAMILCAARETRPISPGPHS